MADNGAHVAEEDPAAAFLAQQESEIAGIENDGDGFDALDGADSQSPCEPQSTNYGGFTSQLMTRLLAASPELAGASSLVSDIKQSMRNCHPPAGVLV